MLCKAIRNGAATVCGRPSIVGRVTEHWRAVTCRDCLKSFK